jgi:hypothetical protein
MEIIETANLRYVNGFIPHEVMVNEYAKAEKIIKDIPVFAVKFKTQLKNMGQAIVAAVAGFVSMPPVGLFIGLASAVATQVAAERAKYQGLSTTILQPSNTQAQNTVAIQQQEKANAEAAVQLNQVMVIGSVLVGGALLYFGKDLKKLMK